MIFPITRLLSGLLVLLGLLLHRLFRRRTSEPTESTGQVQSSIQSRGHAWRQARSNNRFRRVNSNALLEEMNDVLNTAISGMQSGLPSQEIVSRLTNSGSQRLAIREPASYANRPQPPPLPTQGRQSLLQPPIRILNVPPDRAMQSLAEYVRRSLEEDVFRNAVMPAFLDISVVRDPIDPIAAIASIRRTPFPKIKTINKNTGCKPKIFTL